MPLRQNSLHLQERLRRSGGACTLPPPGCILDKMDPEGRPLTWLLTCASLSQAEVRGHGSRGLAEGRADGGKGVEL